MKNMHFYGSDDWNVKVNFTINGQIMGSVLSHSGTAAISVSVTDPDLESTSNITIYYGIPGSGINASVLTSTTSSNILNYNHLLANNTSYYYYLKITQADGDLIYTSPIWYKRNDLISQYPPNSEFNSIGTFTNCVETYSFTDMSTNTPTSWFWNLPGAIPSTSTLQNPIVTYTANGIENITLIATNAAGSSAVITHTVFVDKCVGIEDLTIEQLSIYPNPANTSININLGTIIDKIDIKLIDMLGKEIMFTSFQGPKTEINLKGISEGVYYLKLSDSNQHTVIKKLIISYN